MKFSVIVPTYNEEKDISRTLKALENLQWPDFEVMIVDDASKDRTPEIIRSFSDRLPNFRFLPQTINRGVSAVRNIAIRAAEGDVMVMVNADVLLPPDFMQKMVPYFAKGNKWVSVTNKIINLDKVYPRFVEASGYYFYTIQGKHWMWTEGLSCTKEAALGVGLFPEAMPGCSGEDIDFGLKLEKQYPGTRTMEILVPHIAPDELREFWGQQRGRGQGRTNNYRYMKGLGIPALLLNSLLSSGWRILKMACLIPIFWRAWKYSKFSDRGRKDFLPFIWVIYVAELAMLAGMWRAFRRILAGKK